MWNFFDRYRDLGLLILRVGVGAAFIAHGWPKLMAGPETWAGLGGAMGLFGVRVAPEFWGLCAALAEAAGGLCFALGLFFRPASLALALTMAVAFNMHFGKGDPFKVYSHALEAGFVFAGMFFVGPGKYSVEGGLGARR
jgi:putative oxidoreductase